MALHWSRIAVAALVGALIVPARSILAQSNSTAAALNHASEVYAHVTTARGSFEMTIENPLTGRSDTSRANFQQERPSRLDIRFTNPSGDRIVADGKWVWAYLPSATPDQVVRMPVGDGHNTPAGGAVSLDFISQFLTDPAVRFTVTGAGSDTLNGHSTTIAVLVPHDPEDQIARAKLWIDNGDGIVRRFEWTDASSTVRRVRVLTESFNVPVEQSAFTFKPPHGVKVVDQSALVNGTD
jgi:outer membrane lipoprotein carrier protein